MELRDAQLKAGHLVNTRKCYRGWMLRYRAARRARQCRNLQTYLDHLTTVERVSPKTVKQALNALKFYHEKVLGIEIPEKSLSLPRVNPHKNVPVWLTHEEAMDLIGRMQGLARLQAELLYGTGSRITALLTLRLKDIDLGQQIVVFRHDKGGKSRSVRIPASVMPRLSAHVATVRLQWEADRSRGIICPSPEPSLMAKLGRKRFGTLAWCWLFPSAVLRGDERWHATDRALTSELHRAAEESGITKRVSPHVFRHSNATALLERGENIRTIQEHLGHTNVETTEIYTHATCSEAVISPMDMAPPIRSNIVPIRRTA
jgi:site-specific recombinase XerD